MLDILNCGFVCLSFNYLRSCIDIEAPKGTVLSTWPMAI